MTTWSCDELTASGKMWACGCADLRIFEWDRVKIMDLD